MTEELALSVIIGAAIGVATILSPLIVKGIYYLINKDKCLTILKNMVSNQEEETKNGKEAHKDIYNRLNHIDKSVSKIAGHLGIDED